MSLVHKPQKLPQILSDDTVDATPATDGVDDQPATTTYTCQACGAPKQPYQI